MTYISIGWCFLCSWGSLAINLICEFEFPWKEAWSKDLGEKFIQEVTLGSRKEGRDKANKAIKLVIVVYSWCSVFLGTPLSIHVVQWFSTKSDFSLLVVFGNM